MEEYCLIKILDLKIEDDMSFAVNLPSYLTLTAESRKNGL